MSNPFPEVEAYLRELHVVRQLSTYTLKAYRTDLSLLQENAKEANRRGLLESGLSRYQLKYKNKFEKTEPNINKRTKWLALELFAKCEGANIIPL